MIDRTLLSKGKDFEDLVDTYVIFITENDKFGKGIPLYHIERRIEEMDYAVNAQKCELSEVLQLLYPIVVPAGRLPSQYTSFHQRFVHRHRCF